MTDARLLDYNKAHFGLLDLRQTEKDDAGADELEALASVSVCKTLVVDGRIVAIMGFYMVRFGVVNVFVLPSVYVRQYAKTFLKHIKQEFEGLWANPDLHRMQTQSKADPETDNWMDYLGFHCEGTMVGYSQCGEDYRMWARTFKDGTTGELDSEP